MTGELHEAVLGKTPIRDLGLTIAGTRLEPILARFEGDLAAAGISRLRPRCYLSTEWGVPMDTVAIAIPFYLARADLTELHARRAGHVEGTSPGDILRYLRHEMGHVVNYAYRLYDRAEWVNLFGAITQPYLEEYRPQPFVRRYVLHLPGFYAQKHPDEDFAETFAVWMTPGRDWRSEYRGWPEALAKLEYCDQTMAELRDVPPLVEDVELDEDVGEIDYSIDDYYRELPGDRGADELPPGLDGALRAIFEELDVPDAPRLPADSLCRRLSFDLCANVYRWTGHFPERTRVLIAHLAERATALGLEYAAEREGEAVVALTTFITALAMNHVHSGDYLP
jgi:hypothetical protein